MTAAQAARIRSLYALADKGKGKGKGSTFLELKKTKKPRPEYAYLLSATDYIKLVAPRYLSRIDVPESKRSEVDLILLDVWDAFDADEQERVLFGDIVEELNKVLSARNTDHLRRSVRRPSTSGGVEVLEVGETD